MSTRRVLVLLVLVAGLAFVGDPRPDPRSAVEGWIREDPLFSPAVADCVGHYLRQEPLQRLRSVPISYEDLERRGLDAIPADQRQLFGDVLVACTVHPRGPDGS